MAEVFTMADRIANEQPIISAGQAFCDLCGLPVDSAGKDEDGHRFCCLGCRQVFLIIADASGVLPTDFQKTDFFRACIEAGLVPVGNTVPSASEKTPEYEIAKASLDLDLLVTGMWCPACAWVIEEVLKKMAGVIEPHVSFFADAARLRYLPHVVTPTEISARIAKLGYGVNTELDRNHVRTSTDDLAIRLGISAVLTMNIMMLSFAFYFGFIRDLTRTATAYFSYPLAIMTIPVVFYGGSPIFRRAWASLKLLRPSLEAFISLSVLSAFFYSLIQMVRGDIHLYFDTAAMLVTIVLLGRYIEMRARAYISAPLQIDETGPQKARLFISGSERWVNAEAVRPGDLFLVQTGERTPVDGRIVKGRGSFDQSFITGESTPVRKNIDDTVMAGSLIVHGEAVMTATRPARESSFRRMADLMREALERKSSTEELADSVSHYVVPAVLLITAMMAFLLLWWGCGPETILLRCLTILLVSCPCALGIATPLVKVVIIGLGRRKGILVRNPQALERVREIDIMVLDKTGTVTEGTFRLRRVVCDGTDEREALSMISAIESASSHLLAREIFRYAAHVEVEALQGSQIEELEGMGVIGVVHGKNTFAGNRRLFSQCGAQIASGLDTDAQAEQENGMTVIFFGWEAKVHGFLVFGDRIKEGAPEMVQWLTDRGVKVLLLSGDSERTTQVYARSLGIAQSIGEALPHEKAQVVKTLRQEGRIVGMIGDGVNDGAALAQADVGFTMGSNFSVIHEASDLLIPSGRTATITDIFYLSGLSRRKVRQNLSFAFLYNVIAIPLAATGFLNPLMAVSLMFASSLTVIGNTLHAARFRAAPAS